MSSSGVYPSIFSTEELAYVYSPLASISQTKMPAFSATCWNRDSLAKPRLLDSPVRGEVLDDPVVERDLALGIAHRARTFANKNDRPVAPAPFALKARYDAFGLDPVRETMPANVRDRRTHSPGPARQFGRSSRNRAVGQGLDWPSGFDPAACSGKLLTGSVRRGFGTAGRSRVASRRRAALP